jgi:hypothetical protein
LEEKRWLLGIQTESKAGGTVQQSSGEAAWSSRTGALVLERSGQWSLPDKGKFLKGSCRLVREEGAGQLLMETEYGLLSQLSWEKPEVLASEDVLSPVFRR